MKVAIVLCNDMHMDIDKANQLIGLVMQSKGYEMVCDYQEADIIIVYTCAFGPHLLESLQILADVSLNAKQSAEIIATGCLTKLKPEDFAKIPGIQMKAWDDVKKMFGTSDDSKPLMTSQNVVIVSEGCLQKCSYCVYPQFMSEYHSKPMEEIEEEVKRLYETEETIYLTGALETSSYGMDLYGKRCFPELLERIATKYPDCRFVVGWFHPVGLTKKMIDTLARLKNVTDIMIHIQHVDNEILKSMNRPSFEYTHERILMLKSLRPDIRISSEVIVGYPGETIEKFKHLCSYLAEGYFSDIGVASFEPVPGTKAFKLEEQIPKEERLRRMEIIRKYFDATCYPEGTTLNFPMEVYYQNVQDYLRQFPKHMLNKVNDHHLIARPDTDAKMEQGFLSNLTEVYQLVQEARTPFDFQQNKQKFAGKYTKEAREFFGKSIQEFDCKEKLKERAREMLK